MKAIYVKEFAGTEAGTIKNLSSFVFVSLKNQGIVEKYNGSDEIKIEKTEKPKEKKERKHREKPAK